MTECDRQCIAYHRRRCYILTHPYKQKYIT
jgi:hypothetical protein